MQITDAFEDYLHYIQVVENKSLATVASYRNDLKEYRAFLDAHGFTAIEDVTYMDPVSYTHLDVYKRQELDRTIDGILHRQDAITKLEKARQKAYAAYETQAKQLHTLRMAKDVYKRQMIRCAVVNRLVMCNLMKQLPF